MAKTEEKTERVKDAEQVWKEATEPLSDKQTRFVEEYLLDLCKGAAAKRAGYSEAGRYTEGHRLCRNPKIKEAIKAGLELKAANTHINPSWVIEQFQRNARLAEEKGDIQARNRALSEIGKAIGMFDRDLNVNVNHGGEAKVVLYYPDNGRGPKGE